MPGNGDGIVFCSGRILGSTPQSIVAVCVCHLSASGDRGTFPEKSEIHATFPRGLPIIFSGRTVCAGGSIRHARRPNSRASTGYSQTLDRAVKCGSGNSELLRAKAKKRGERSQIDFDGATERKHCVNSVFLAISKAIRPLDNVARWPASAGSNAAPLAAVWC